jgi:hypothetical protein
MTAARAVRFKQLIREASKQLKCKPTSERAKHVATLRYAREHFAERLIAGRDVNPEHLLKLDDALKQYLPQATSAPPVTKPLLTLQICSKKIHSVCERCGHIQPTDVDTPAPPSKYHPPSPLLLPAPTNGDEHDN